ncbi:MAG: CDP-alcohol phosphatidyltransferase family protein, partial [Prevotella sp.]
MGIRTDERVRATYKATDTEEWLDRVWTRPIGYRFALFFGHLGIHPNAVTLLSMLIGAASALLFAHGSLRTEGMEGLWLNIAAVVMLSVANFLDSADGQLARMTGKKTRLGRILDGAAGEVWFVPIYLALVWRFYCHHGMEFAFLGIDDTVRNALTAALLLLLLVLFSGFHCHSGQCGLADYYRQAHLFFLKGEAESEFDTSVELQKQYEEMPWKGNVLYKIFMKTYVRYTRRQECRTPCFQRMMARLRITYGRADNIPQEFRDRYRALSLPLMRYANLLTFNLRAVMLYALCIADMPWMYFLFETVVMEAMCSYM